MTRCLCCLRWPDSAAAAAAGTAAAAAAACVHRLEYRAVSMGARVDFRLRRTGAGAALQNCAVQSIR